MKPTLSIGIAAYNEAENIGPLLSALLEQNIKSAHLVDIIVVSDASTDGTDAIVLSFSASHVELRRLPERRGSCNAQNIITGSVKSDILVMLDADILPENEFFIEKLIQPIIEDSSVGLTSATLLPATPRTFVEKILSRNHEWKKGVFSQINQGNNLYTCFGPARAFSRKLYAMFQCPNDCPYDAISYMYCATNHLRFVSVDYPRAVFRCPSNLSDHIKQSSRFLAGKDAVVKLFGQDAEHAYVIPRSLFIKSMVKEFLFHPILFGAFVVMSMIVRTHQKDSFVSTWDMATSSKKI
ncbi:MAG: glycosyltransferase [bacterium]|nr:glycosyltransferase [bacterium]